VPHVAILVPSFLTEQIIVMCLCVHFWLCTDHCVLVCHHVCKQISNIVELQPLLAPLLPSTLAQLTVKAKGSVSSSIRLDLTFEAAQFAPQTLFGREVSLLLMHAIVCIAR
jgi:hypothetical protein